MIKVTLFNGKAVQSVQLANHGNVEQAISSAMGSVAGPARITLAIVEDSETGEELARRKPSQ